jgi:hypothetical protein
VKASRTLGSQQTAFANYAMKQIHGGMDIAPETMLWLVDWKAYGKPYCSLYVVTPDNGWPCKVGVSVHPYKRVAQLQTSVWKPLEVAGCFWLPTVADAKTLERKLHETLTEENKWLHGEWFDMRPEDVLPLVSFSASVAGVECSDRIEDEHALNDVRERLLAAAYKGNGQKKRADAFAEFTGICS